MKTNSQGKKATPAGLWPESLRTKGGTCRPWLIDGRGKAWSKRPDRQAGRHGRKRPPLRGAKTGTNHARPTSRPPAQPGACARHAGKVRGDREAAKNRLSGRWQASTVPKTGGRGSRKAAETFSGTRQGAGQGRASGSRRPSALNLSCFQEKQSVSNGKAVFVRRTTPPRPSPARGASRPLSSGVQAAGRFASFDCPPDWRLGPFQWHQGCGFAHVLTRSVLAVPAALRVRPPGVPLTPLPLENRGSAGQIARFALAAGRRTGCNNLAR